jgi:hypothetical protein
MLSESTTTAGQAADHREGCGQPACPVCTGLLVPLGGLWRCSRCYFTLCEGCEGGPIGGPYEHGD